MSEETSVIVETQHLTKIYHNRRIALNDVSLRIPAGAVLGLVGPNGAGKTTLLRLLLGLQRPTAGWVKVFGQKMTPNAAHLRRRMGYIPSQPQFPRGLTPIAYLDYMGRLFGLSRQERKPRLAALLRAVELLDVSGEPIAGFSHGMTVRLALAASLINDPELLIWDEPTHGLDPEARRSMLELIKNLSQAKTLIVSSHNLSDVDEVCTQVAILSEGHLIYNGSLQELRGKMRGRHFELDLEGDQKAIAKVVQTVRGLAEVKQVQLRQRRLEIILQENGLASSALASIFMTLADNKVDVLSLRSAGQPTEQAFLQLVEQEESRGFARAWIYREAA
ncbi:putative ABC transporter ATP-binding protein YxlF [bacterium HR36]|nr:putative ABC transporter ATP-binding protein YxlF [bacterium HR36]